MDDHLFLNLRTVCSRLLTVGEMKISYFLHFSPPPLPSSRAAPWLASAEDGETSAGKRKKKQTGRGADVRPHLALFSVCDKWRRFLHLADRSIFCSKSASLPTSPQPHPPHPSLLSLGRTSWQLSHSRCFTDEEQPPLPRRPFPFFFFSSLPLTC